MNAKLIYLFLLSLWAACALSSCASDAPGSDGPDKKAELTFTVSGLSRASVVTDIARPGSKFAVYGDRALQGSNNDRPLVVFNKTEVEYIDNVWRYDNPQYWFPEHEHSFIAVYPLSAVAAANATLYSDSKLSFTYSVPVSAGDKIAKNDVPDILAATHRRYYHSGDAMPVSLKFNHLLSLINIAPALNDNILGDDGFIRIHKLELTGLKNKASFSIVPASRLTATQTDDRVIEVFDQDGETHMTIEFADPKTVMNHADNMKLFDQNDALIMLPQTFAADSQAKIILTYTINDEQQPREVSAPLMRAEWATGKSYTYNLTIERTGLIFGTTTISDWEEMDAGNINAH